MRLVFFILTAICALVVPWWLLVPVFALHALRFGGVELLVLGAFLDAFFGVSTGAFWYTAFAGCAVVGAMLLRPRIAF